MYEQGRREPSLAGVVDLSRAFGVTVDYLLTGTPLTETDCLAMTKAVEKEVLEQGRRSGFSRQELAVLFAAMLTEA
jgi:transcriptional regulator with XRE-family HTH domain